MANDPIVLSAIVGASFSFLVVTLFNVVREAHRRMAAASRNRKDEIWE